MPMNSNLSGIKIFLIKEKKYHSWDGLGKINFKCNQLLNTNYKVFAINKITEMEKISNLKMF